MQVCYNLLSLYTAMQFWLVYIDWRAEHALPRYHSVLLGSYILVSGHDCTYLRRVKKIKVGVNSRPIFITTVKILFAFSA